MSGLQNRKLPASVFYFHPNLIFLNTKLSDFSPHRLPVLGLSEENDKISWKNIKGYLSKWRETLCS